MDPLCVSLVHQFLENTNSALVDQFKARHKPKETSVKLEEVLSKWNEEQMARSIVHQHLKRVSPSLALEFGINQIYPLNDVPEQLVESITKSHLTQLEKAHVKEKEDEEKLARQIVYQHLRKVAPSLAHEFRVNHDCCTENVPKQLEESVKKCLRQIQNMAETKKTHTVTEVSGENCKNPKFKKAGPKVNTYTAEEVLRIERAIVNKENIGAVALEMGRTYESVQRKFYSLKHSVGLKTGKFTVAENERIRVALENNESYVSVAKELNRRKKTVHHKMSVLRSNPNPKQGKTKYSLGEDRVILEKVIPFLKLQKLSSQRFLPTKDVMDLATELKRNHLSVSQRWDEYLHPMLLQHYTGTSGFRVERMLTSLVAQKYKDHKGIDWSEIVDQHKEFAGHTSASVSRVFQNCLKFAKKQKNTTNVSLQEVADCDAKYNPTKEPKAKTARKRREKIVEHFIKRVESLGINVVV